MRNKHALLHKMSHFVDEIAKRDAQNRKFIQDGGT
jgi:hypothetical protein